MKKFFTILSFSLLPLAMFAQTVVRGIVTDAATKEPLVGCTVVAEGTNSGATTDINGVFVLSVPASAGNKFNLIARYTGFSGSKVTVIAERGDLIQNIELGQDNLQLQDVVVSANKRFEASQKVPQSISVLTPTELKRARSFEATDYFFSIPNLSIASSGGGGNAGFGDGRSSGRDIAIRGVSGDKTTALYLDDTPLPAFADPKLFDIERVEVLRGPQGTLYGSSTMGGAVKVITKQPNAYKNEGSIEVSGAKVTEGDADYGLQGIYNVPLKKEKAALRLGAFYNFKSGFYDRVRQTHFNGFPLNTGDGTGANPGAVYDHDEDPGTPNVPWTDGSIPITLQETGNLSAQNGWKAGETRRDNVNDEKSFGINAALGLYPTNKISIVPKLIYQKTSGSGFDFADFKPGNFTQYRMAGLDESYDLDLLHGGLSVKYGLKKGELTNSLSYNKVNQTDVEDVTERESSGASATELGGFDAKGDFRDPKVAYWYPEFIKRTGNMNKFVEELRYSSSLGGKFNFTTGLFFSAENIKYDASQERKEYLSGLSGYLKTLIGVGVPAGVLQPLIDYIENGTNGIWYSQKTDVKTKEFALFGEAYYDLTRQLRLTAGLRYFNAAQDFSQLLGGFVGNGVETNPGTLKGSGINPKINLTYQVNNNSNIYVNAAKGYRLGGLNPSVPVVFAGKDLAALGLSQAPESFKSDAIWTYEIGSKNTLAGGKMIFNAAAFHSQWNGLQQRVFLPSGFLFIDNVGKATMTGMEVELKGKVNRQIQISGALGYVDAKIKEGSRLTNSEAGDRVLNVPQLTASANVQYTKTLNDKSSIFGFLDISHTGDRVNTFNPDAQPQFVFDAFTMMNASVGYTMKHLEVSLFSKNLTNTSANYGDITALAATPYKRYRYATSRPRTVGVSLKYAF